MNTLYTVPISNIIAMIIVGILSFLIPIFLGIYLSKKQKLNWSLFLTGALVFIVFALILESIFNWFILNHTGSLGEDIQNETLLYAMYGGFAAGLFEESGRYITFKYILKKQKNPKSALMLGAGHGGAEAMIIVGLTMLNNLLYALLINFDLLSKIITDSETYQALMAQLEPLATTASGQFYLSIFERVIAIALHIALSIMVFKAAKQDKPLYLLYAFLIHMVFDFTTVMLAATIPSIYVELALFVLLIPIVFWSFIILKKMLSTYNSLEGNINE